METSSHIIEKVVVEVNTTQVKTANFIKNNLDTFLKRELFPKLEKLLQKYDRPNAVIRFHNININLNVSDWENREQIKYELLFEFEEHLKKQLAGYGNLINTTGFDEAPGDGNLQNLTVDKNEEELFFYFLKNGFLPWYGNESQIKAFQQKENWENSFSRLKFVQQLKYLLQKDGTLFVRFFYQFPIEMVMAFIKKINERLALVDDHIIATFKPMRPDLKMEFFHVLFLVSVEKKNDRIIAIIQRWLKLLLQNRKVLENKGDELLSNIGQLILRSSPDSVVSDEKFQEILNESLVLISKNKFPDDIRPGLYEDKIKLETRLSEKVKQSEDLNRDFFENHIPEIAVQNAGLVILHPFLKYFFYLLKITNKLGEIIPSKREVAVQTLHYLATGSEEFFEGNLVLEKFLCGMPLNMPVPKQSLLTSRIRKEAEIMLSEVIKNWPALKNTSPAGLRQMFIQREGKLIQNNKNCKLIIERKTQDILLEKLSWNISIIKLNWLSEMLYVEW